MSYLFFSRRTAAFLAEKSGLDREKETILAYIIEILVLNTGNLLLALLLGWFLGVLPGVTACIAAAILFRHTAGGAHSSSPWRCGAVTIIVFPTMALLATYLSGLGRIYTDTLSLAAIFTSLVAVAALAPVDTQAAPIISPARRKRLKGLSLLVFTLITMAIVFIRWAPWLEATEIQICLALSLLWTSFNLSRSGYWFMSFVDDIKIPKRRR